LTGSAAQAGEGGDKAATDKAVSAHVPNPVLNVCPEMGPIRLTPTGRRESANHFRINNIPRR